MRAATVYYYVTDLDRALKFYMNVLGLPLKHRFDDRWAEVDAGPITIGLHPLGPNEQVVTGAGGTVSFTVDKDVNFERFVEELRTRGATVAPIRSPPRGKFTIVKDPDGNELHFIQFSEKWRQENRY